MLQEVLKAKKSQVLRSDITFMNQNLNDSIVSLLFYT